MRLEQGGALTFSVSGNPGKSEPAGPSASSPLSEWANLAGQASHDIALSWCKHPVAQGPLFLVKALAVKLH